MGNEKRVKDVMCHIDEYNKVDSESKLCVAPEQALQSVKKTDGEPLQDGTGIGHFAAK